MRWITKESDDNKRRGEQRVAKHHATPILCFRKIGYGKGKVVSCTYSILHIYIFREKVKAEQSPFVHQSASSA